MARPKLGDGETQRLQLKIGDDELEIIDDWRYANRIPSRSEAVRRLMQIAIRTQSKLTEGGKMAAEAFSKVDHIYQEWERLLEEEDDPKQYAYKVTLLVGDHFTEVHAKTMDVSIAINGLIEELQKIQETSDFGEAVKEADRFREMLNAADARHQERFEGELRKVAEADSEEK